jgi:hypothetical protein
VTRASSALKKIAPAREISLEIAGEIAGGMETLAGCG